MAFELKQVFASLPQTERGVAKVIGGDPKGTNFLYTNGKSVLIRNIDNPAIADIYTEHSHPVSVAKYAPSGFYIASGDAAGKIRIWDTTQKDHLTKYEYQPIAGIIKDIAWTEDSKRVAIAGQGREKCAAVFLWDSGSSVGDIYGHSKIVNSVDIRQTRPYRLVTGSDDKGSAFFEGPPFKYKMMNLDHSGFVNCVRFSPDGNHYAAAGSDGKIVLYDGKTGEKITALGGEKAHEGGIYAISWSADSSQLIISIGRQDAAGAASGRRTTCLSISPLRPHQLPGQEQPRPRPLRILKGHNKSIHCLTVHKTEERSNIYTGSNDGGRIRATGHLRHGRHCAFHTNFAKKEYSARDLVKMDVQPKSLSVAAGYVLVVCIEQLVLLKDGKKVFTLDSLEFDPEAVALHQAAGLQRLEVRTEKCILYSIQGNTLKDEGKTLDAKGPVTDVAYSSDGAYLAVSDEKKAISVFNVADGYTEIDVFYGHHAKVMRLAWSPDNEHFASSGMDTMVYIWTVSDPDKRLKIQDAHRLHHVSGLSWLNENTLVTTSHDSCIKQWTVQF
ncbi:hypothetical protein SKAU_G00030580 [Synaphobranchus kaupii]|uniref:WD repeat-containing protein 1 n=1 Tax=Synaphobranchus kaupii TaxID=118154 RepID=A0A9Q1GDP5_SYNKA|nr:hypothetical protein SKAU_G00030580 [Synaphobranchus kaupii]